MKRRLRSFAATGESGSWAEARAASVPRRSQGRKRPVQGYVPCAASLRQGNRKAGQERAASGSGVQTACPRICALRSFAATGKTRKLKRTRRHICAASGSGTQTACPRICALRSFAATVGIREAGQERAPHRGQGRKQPYRECAACAAFPRRWETGKLRENAQTTRCIHAPLRRTWV